MIIVQVQYKIYDWSKKANALSILSAIFKGTSILGFFFIAIILLNLISNNNINKTLVIPIVLIVSTFLCVTGFILAKKADIVAMNDLEIRVKKDFNFARKMAHKHPENKNWYMNLNSEYANFVNSGKDLCNDAYYNKSKKLTPAQLIITFLIVFIFILGGFYLLGTF